MDTAMPKYILRPDVKYYGPEAMHLTARFSPADAVFDSSKITRKKLDVSYGPLPEQLIDIYYPEEGEGPFPTVFFVHGGAFLGGDRHSGSAKIISTCLKHGYVLISVEYRLSPTTKFPEFLYDVKTAVRYARANAKELSLDPDRLAMAGDSVEVRELFYEILWDIAG
ncbi:MAG: alpha/beta hydrolase, partial [Oscillospiraceae bacterium]|nr:alpha/beta hydrolase [Oscillospiraceae bacterium]